MTQPHVTLRSDRVEKDHPKSFRRFHRKPLPPALSYPPPACPSPWVCDAGMHEPLYLTFDAYPSVIPLARVRGAMALFLAVTILWALIW
jgi:hypothetical protein